MTYLSCRVDPRAGSLSCGGSEAGLEGGALGAIIGGQGVYVQLTSTNVSYDEASQVFSAVVSVHNLGNQVIGSSDGVTPHANGVRVFFVSDPVTTQGTGDVSVRNGDGTADFTANGQTYFRYSQALAPGRTSLPKSWEWDVPTTVEKFEFLVGVSAEVADDANFAPGLAKFTETIAADSLHTCALDYSGQAWCWGVGSLGRLGTGSTADATMPMKVQQSDLRFVSIGVGLSHTCALTDAGEIYCWGSNTNGRLGVGDSINVTSSNVPILINGGRTYKQLAVGRSYTCALDVEDELWCWGNNANRHFANDTTANAAEPVRGAVGMKFALITAGGFHTCGITLDGETFCWGSSSNGKLGIGTVSGAQEPQLVAPAGTFTRIWAAQNHTCALTPESKAYCWGLGLNGRTGIGSEDTARVPTEVATNERFASISPSRYHTCAVTIDGRGFCWGSNGRGKVGTGNTSATANPFPLEVVGGHLFAQVAAGADHSCGVTLEGRVYCWGNAGSGRLGDGGVSGNTGTPVQTYGMPAVAFDWAPQSCDADAGAGCFQRRTFHDHVLLALGRSPAYFVLDLS